jgi:uncharacterized glyoxalase superfamily protein PhnB
MTITLTHTFITVHDQDDAIAFYRDVLGLELRNDMPFDENFRWVSVGSKDQPEVEIVLGVPEMGRSPEDAQSMRELVAKGSADGLIFRTPDVDATFESIRKAGAEVIQEPMDQPWGQRDCAFRDPSGNHLRFSRAAKE